jgi:Tfp pilus assembly protein PilO
MAAGLPLLACLLLYGLWLLPVMHALQEQEARSQAARQQFEELMRHQQAERELAEVVPSKTELPQAIGRITVLGRRAGLSIPELSIQPTQAASPQWAKVTLQFAAQGPYAGVRRFLAAIERADEPYVIESFSLAKDRESDSVVAQFILSIYAREG